MRKITITISEDRVLSEQGSATVTTVSNTYGPGSVGDQIGEVAKAIMKMWAVVDPQSCTPKPDGPTGRPRPAPRDGR